jgi:hypothetical protein
VITNTSAIQAINPHVTLKCAYLDWSRYLRPDFEKVEWIQRQCTCNPRLTDVVGDNDVEADLNEVDLIIGSALVYSVDGAFMCADTIYHFFEQGQLQRALILQMATRPGYDRFLHRLLSLGCSISEIDLSEKVFTLAETLAGHEIRSKQHFKLIEIKR